MIKNKHRRKDRIFNNGYLNVEINQTVLSPGSPQKTENSDADESTNKLFLNRTTTLAQEIMKYTEGSQDIKKLLHSKGNK